MAESPLGRGQTASAEAHCGPSEPPLKWRRTMGESAPTERLGEPLRDAVDGARPRTHAATRPEWR
eukprot:5384817-Alexandrium_andersonii.AAC.1